MTRSPSGVRGSAVPLAQTRADGRLIRVLFVHSTMEIGGAEEVRLSLLTHLDRTRYHATMCCLQRGGTLAEEVAALGYEVIALGYRAHALSIPTLRALRRLIREHRPHIVQSCLPRANYWGRLAAILERVPLIVAEEHAPVEPSDRARPLLERILGPRTDCVIAVSETVRSAVASMGGATARRPTVVIPNPVNSARLRAQRSRTQVRGELGVSADEFLVVSAGRMELLRGPKGHDTLIEAMADLPAGGPRVVCALLGDGPARPQFEGLAEKLRMADRMRFLGFRRDVADILAAADLFAFPSRVEGMPLALMEAMWMGVPVVASDIPANREVLGQGQYGRFVPPLAPRALAEAVSVLAGNKVARDALALEAQAYARRTFMPELHAQRMEQLWERLLVEHSDGRALAP